MAIALIFAPTVLAVVLDFVVRARSIVHLPWFDLMNYVGSTLAASGMWSGPLWMISRLFLVRGRWLFAARAGLSVFFVGLFFPYAFFVYGGQPLYYRVCQAYIARDTVRLGMRLFGTVVDWLRAWGAGVVWMAVVAVVVTALIAALTRRAATALASTSPVVPVGGFVLTVVLLWNNMVESRGVQAAPPDACFLHGLVRTAREELTHGGRPTRGVTLRTPDPLPPLSPSGRRPDVIVILSESLRADALCAAKTAGCDAPFLDEAAPDRAALGLLTAQSSGTFTSCMVLWTGLPPDADFVTAHRAPMLWELAHAVGYHTAYITSQNLRYAELSAYVERTGAEVKAGAVDLGESIGQQLGALDENATRRMLEVVRQAPAGTPFFGLLHLSNTHAPYRADPALQPFSPHDDNPLGDLAAFHNHYRNAVRLQERTVAAFLRDLRTSPRWDSTVVLFLSDHAEQFREHGRLYHLHFLFDEEVRMPGFLLAGPHALDDAQRAALHTYDGRRTYTQDVQATVLDLLGLQDQRGMLPFASLVTGRSLLRPRSDAEPMAILSTTSGVWDDDDPRFGVRRGDLLLVGTEDHSFECYDSRTDPGQHRPAPLARCGAAMMEVATKRFPQVPAAPSAPRL